MSSGSASLIQQSNSALSQVSYIMRSKYAALFTLSESITEELSHKFKPTILECVLRRIDQILYSAFKGIFQHFDGDGNPQEDALVAIGI